MAGLPRQGIAQTAQAALVSFPGGPTISASGHSYAPVLSSDSHYVVFLSSAKNLVTDDNLAPYLDVFRHNLQTGETVLISRAANAIGGANAEATVPTISSDGQSVAFVSAASDLLSGSDNNGEADIFVADGDSSPPSLITIGRDGKSPTHPFPTRTTPLSGKPYISGNGRWIAFESLATNLTAESDLNSNTDVFLRDTLNHQTLRVSVGLDSVRAANGKSEIADITVDGNCVLFATSTNASPSDPMSGNQELYVRDVAAETTTWVRHTNTIPSNTPARAPYVCRSASISSDGAFVLYKVEFPPPFHTSYARVHLYDRQADSNIVVTARAAAGYSIDMSRDSRFIAYDEFGHVLLWDRQTGSRTRISDVTNSYSPQVSDDGSIVAFINAAPRSGFQIYYRDMVTMELRRLTEALSGGPSAKDHINSSLTVDPGADFILFDSTEDDLVADDRNQASDIFIHHVQSRETRLISRAHAERPADTAVGSSGITNFCLSADGNRLLFFSSDSNLVPGDTNGWHDAFVRDLSSGQTFALSTNASGGFSPSNSVPHGVLSGNGRYALLGGFHTASRVESFSVPASIIRKDLQTGEALPVLSDARALNPSPFSLPWFAFSSSADGRYAAYPSNNFVMIADMETGVQTNLTAGDSGWYDPLISSNGRYVLHTKRSYASGPGTLVITDLSTGGRTIITNNHSTGAMFSPNSDYVVYRAPAGLTVGLHLYSILANISTVVCTSCANPSVSADARFVAYDTTTTPPRQIEIKDMVTGVKTLVTGVKSLVPPFSYAAANGSSANPSVSSDGRFVIYTSYATNLTADPPNGWNNLYVYDRLQGSTVRITGTLSNTGYGSGPASRPVLGPDGRTLVFQSFASDFVSNDFNGTRDIFLLRLGDWDSDNDVMSDSWEQTHFNTTDRDGTGDFDNDGQTDLAEYLAGTNPANGQSVFEVLQITSMTSSRRQLIWRAQPGRAYRVEYKSDLANANWTSLGQIITATAPTASALDTTATFEKRFYRVALVQ